MFWRGKGKDGAAGGSSSGGGGGGGKGNKKQQQQQQLVPARPVVSVCAMCIYSLLFIICVPKVSDDDAPSPLLVRSTYYPRGRTKKLLLGHEARKKEKQ